MVKLTVVMPYYNNLEMMKVQLATWHTYPSKLRDWIRFIVVDDCSTVPLHIDEAKVNLTVLRIEEDIVWNVSGARNLGGHYCKTDWFMMTDIDMLLTAEAARKLIKLPRTDWQQIWQMKHRDASLIQNTGFCANHMLLSKKLFWKCCGYDEDYAGSYGGQEGHLASKLFREGGVRSLEHKVVLINFGEYKSPIIIKDATCSTEWMRSPEGLERTRKISERLYNTDRDTGVMPRKEWNKNVLRFKWHVAQEFNYAHRD